MSHFYGWVQGNRGDAHRGGSKQSGIWAKIQSWHNSCRISLDERGGKDELSISIEGDAGRDFDGWLFINGKRYVVKNGELKKAKTSTI